MHLLSALSLAVAVSASAHAFGIERRAAFAGGGWGLLTKGTCPVGYASFGYNKGGDDILTVCCPPNFSPQDDSGDDPGRTCCPTGRISNNPYLRLLT